MELEEDYERNKGSGTGTETAYTVEARNTCKPIKVGNQIFYDKWLRVEFDKSTIGVPQCAPFQLHTKEHGLLSYQAANALRWWFHAVLEQEMDAGRWSMETRIVKHIISYSHKIEAVSCHGLVSGEDRSNIMPDWGKKDV